MKNRFIQVLLLVTATNSMKAMADVSLATNGTPLQILENSNPLGTHFIDLPVADITGNKSKAAFRFSSTNFEYTTKWDDKGGYIRMINGYPFVSEESAYPYQGVGLVVETNLITDMDSGYTYQFSIAAKARIKPIYGFTRSTPGEGFLQVTANCGNHSPTTVRVNGTPYVGRTDSGDWLPDSQTPNDQLRAEIHGTSFIVNRAECPDGRVNIRVLAQGKAIEFQGLEVSASKYSELPEHLVQRISTERNSKKDELTKIVALLANAAGSKESLYCLIDQYSDDLLMSGIVSELQSQFEKQFGPYKPNELICPSAAKSVLANDVLTCESNMAEPTVFCIVYARYLSAKLWYDSSIQSLIIAKEALRIAGKSTEYIDVTTDEMGLDLEVSSAMLKP